MSEIQVNQRWRQSACSLRGRRLKGNGKEIPGARKARKACKGKEKESSPPPLSLARGLATKFPSFSNACHAGQVELRKEFYKNHNESLYKQGNCWCPFIKLQSQILESFRLELRLQQTSYHLTMFVPGLLFIKLLLKICSFECRVYAKELLGTLNFFHFGPNLRSWGKMNLFEISCLSLHCIELDSFCLVKIGYKSTISSLPAKHVKTVNSHFVDMKSKLIVKSQILYLGPTLLLFYLYQST